MLRRNKRALQLSLERLATFLLHPGVIAVDQIEDELLTFPNGPSPPTFSAT